MSRLSSKVVLITGSSSGIGRAIALEFAAQGTKLIVCADLTPDARLDEAAEPTHERICREFGADKAVFVRTDVTIAADVEAAVKKAAEMGGGVLHVMVNNAGIAINGVPVHEMSEESFEATMRVNAYGPFFGCKYACAQFLRQDLDANGHRGWIVNVASVAGLTGLKRSAAYCASKAAVVNLTRAVALGYAEHKIHVNALCPGFVRTAMTKGLFANEQIATSMRQSTPWWNDGNVSDVARAALFLASEDSAWVTGVALPVDGGFVAR